MKVSVKGVNYFLEVSAKELDLIACALMCYEESTVEHLQRMHGAGVEGKNSLAFTLRPFYVNKATTIGKDLAGIIINNWTEA